jgi:hypothetical protein
MSISIEERMAKVEVKVDRLREDLHQGFLDIKKALDEQNSQFVSKNEFSPIQKIVYGGLSIVLTALCIAVLRLIILS